ncbi:indole-3-acetic acid-induced protein ARG7-like [Juglans microcarpa x Juglans regia]|uniref:indole-3-acetic acid-induced protein ARG7-like n=1 Tax=Juglans microcarpa x Juglans regia TaxID=2249226 RepID=UPI001B7DE29F|nr:indole-3-acetic acid-induced protein ARG7-like [Juglans microcarpa x Juglans regia]
MATSTKRVGKIRQIVRLKQVMLRWKHMNLRRRTDSCPSSYSDSGQRIPPGFIALYVGPERKRFVIPTRFLNLPVFVGLLKKAEEEFGFQRTGGLVLPCEVGFFGEMLKLLETDESEYRGFGLDDFLKLVSEIGSESCNEAASSSSFHMATPLLQKARV